MGVNGRTRRSRVERPRETEVGPLPSDWSILQLEAVTDPARPISYGIVQTGPRVHNGVPCLRVVDIRDGKVLLDGLITTSSAISDSYKRTKLREGDLVVPLRGKVGECAQVTGSLAGANLTRGVALIAILSEYSASYCRHFFSSSRSRARLNGAMNGSALQEIPIAELRKFKIGIPPTKDEQSAIAATLADVDELIDLLDRLLTKKRQIKQGAMQELLSGKRRLPGFKQAWEERQLAELAEIRSGGTPSTRQSDFWSGELPWCTPTDITALGGSKYIAKTERNISEKGLKASSAEMLPAGTIVMTSRATIGECAIASVPLTTNQGFKNFIPYAWTSGEFLYYLLRTQQSAFIALCSGSTFLEIGKQRLVDFVVLCPTEHAEQAAIAQVLSDMDAAISDLDIRLSKARAVKQAVAQALLTGSIRLVDSTARVNVVLRHPQ